MDGTIGALDGLDRPFRTLLACPVDTALLERLLTLMDEGGLTELVYEKDDVKVKLSRRQDSGGTTTLMVPAAAPLAAAPAPVAAPPAAPSPAPAPEAEAVGVEFFRSPMVGTFYARPNPDTDPFVQPGDRVGSESVLCILEAMKVFNEIQAEMSGEIVECLVQDGEAVEYDQPLFKIRTA